MADYQLMAQYPKQQIVRDRNSGGLIAWSAYVTTEAIPATKPDEDWVRERIVAEQIVLNPNVYVDQSMSYFMQDPATEGSLSALMNPFNTEATEATLSDEVQNVIGTFMPRFAAQTVTDAQVQAWWDAHGFADVVP
jgi:phosphoglucomutase